ncbi:MAG: peptidoglycan DD-metalloendopeptidase family protein [Bdellovibrionota bacterium]
MIKFIAFVLFFSLQGIASKEGEQLANIERRLNASLEDKTFLFVEKEQLEIEISAIRTKIKSKKKLIVKRLRALASLKQYSWGKLLLINDLNKLDRDIKILKNLNKYDYDLFKEYSSSLKQLALARNNLQETETDIQKNVESLKTQQEQFYQLEAQQMKFLQHAKKDSLLVYKGHLTRPLESSIKQDFGTLRDKDNQFYLINRGELYTASPGLTVRAIGPGKVIFRDDLMLWRETLIIQHADNYYSVYAGMNNLSKSVGDLVEKNEQLGAVAGGDFYFELRHFDNPINPKSWYRK